MPNAIMNTVYNQFLTTYAPKKTDTRYDTHKRSELKSIYNSMARVNRDAPLYKFDNSPQVRQTVIGIKEEARQLHNTVVSIMGNSETVDFNGKIAYSSNENIISAKYIGPSDLLVLSGPDTGNDTAQQPISADGSTPVYEIEVQSLASPQVNMGKYMPKDSPAPPASAYSFDVNINGQGYEFQFGINEGDTNFDVQNRLSRLINNSGIHLTSSVEEDESGNTALRISSSQVGVSFGQNTQVFSINDENTSQAAGCVDYFGINYVAREASNAHFKVNGAEASSGSNYFILEKNYEITLNGISPNEGETTTIGIKPDTEAFAENISSLVGIYNQFIKSVNEYQDIQSGGTNLLQEMNGITDLYRQEMERLGITPNDRGELSLDKDTLNQTSADEASKQSLAAIKDFSLSLLRKSNQVSLNPVSYINKTVVAYKNPGRTFTSPYVASAYAGMMFNSYC